MSDDEIEATEIEEAPLPESPCAFCAGTGMIDGGVSSKTWKAKKPVKCKTCGGSGAL